MKVLMLADADCIHTIRWAQSLSKRGIVIRIFTLNNFDENIYIKYPKISISKVSIKNSLFTKSDGNLSKMVYLKAFPKLKKVIKEFKPDILHAHYASSYGLLGSISRFSPYIISVWGKDVFDFPRKSIFHKYILKFNFSRANKILSTSHIMADETNLYTKKRINVTPFGIDLNQFIKKDTENVFGDDSIVIGTVKKLEYKYGIEYLIKAFKIVKEKNSPLFLKLMIVGGGSMENKLKTLISTLGLSNDTIFVGKVPYERVPDYLNMLDVYVALSTMNSESFGVAIIEASACELPVVVSNVGGLPEVVDDGKTGIVVNAKNEFEAASAIEKILLDEKLRLEMGIEGRKRVKELYDWDKNVDLMVDIYKKTIN